MSRDFTVVFERLDELQMGPALDGAGQVSDAPVISLENLREMDEISELRRLVIETTEPEPASYAMT